MPELEGFMTVAKVAKETGLDESTIRHHIREGHLKATQIGKRTYLVSSEALKEFQDNPTFHKRGPKFKKLGT